jgi:hypothetical protein
MKEEVGSSETSVHFYEAKPTMQRFILEGSCQCIKIRWYLALHGFVLRVFAHSHGRPNNKNTIGPGHNDTGLYDTSLIEHDNLWYQLIPHY